MPPSARKPAAKKPDDDDAQHANADSEICRQHWPDGWPDGAKRAVCDHGSYKR
jgi:hypothetical protein